MPRDLTGMTNRYFKNEHVRVARLRVRYYCSPLTRPTGDPHVKVLNEGGKYTDSRRTLEMFNVSRKVQISCFHVGVDFRTGFKTSGC